jgi:hydrogenase nickel incorporation protein HypA/HybF
MHELGIIQSIFTTVEQVATENKLKSISKVVLKVGALRQIVPEFLQYAFTSVTEGTIAQAAKLEIEIVPITAKCSNCGAEFGIEEHVYACPKCESAAVKIITGKEIVIENIEGEQ